MEALRNDFAEARLQVYFVDASLPGYQGLMSGLGEGSKVFVIENTSDAFAQMDAALASLTDPVAALHVYSHGREGAIFLGGQWIDEKSLTNGKANTLSSIGNYMTEDGDILLYGCYTGAGVVGESFMAQLARLTRADVATSNNLTGLGGDWVLENSTGPIESGFTKPQDWLAMLAPGKNINGMGVIEGTKDDDDITGFVTNDIIYGHGGKDTMRGKDGNDVYVISNNDAPNSTWGTLVIEDANEGIDTVISRVNSFDLGGGLVETVVSNDDGDVTITVPANPNSAVEYIVLDNPAGFGLVAQHAKGNAYSQTLMGNALSNNLIGGGGHDLLYGYDGDDFLDGGSGAISPGAGESLERNTLIGGKGNDAYIVRSKFDQVIENANEGTDHVFSFVNYTLGANVENLTLLDADPTGGASTLDATNAIGNDLNNVLRGNSSANYLDGGAGNDTLHGSKAGDTVGDTLNGGAGNDAYYIYNADTSTPGKAIPLDTMVEATGGGTDSVYSYIEKYTLGANLENVYLMGDSATMGTGNTLANYIRGNENLGSKLDGGGGTLNDTLEGGYGNDTFVIRRTGDSIKDMGGTANVVQSYVTFDAKRFTGATQLQTIELLDNATPTMNNINAMARLDVATTLKGNSGNNSLVGGDKNDALYDWGVGLDTAGLAYTMSGGADTLIGGKGDDKYYVTKANTVIQEIAAVTASGGIDSVYVAGGVDFTLATGVENLYMDSAATNGQRGVGNALANVIDASAATTGVILMGGANATGQGKDTLIGGTGNDQIYSYDKYDVIDGGDTTNGSKNVLYINYKVDEYEALNDAQKAAFDWQNYFNGINADVKNIDSFVYVGATSVGGGATSMVGVSIKGTSIATNLVGTARNDTLTTGVDAGNKGHASTLDGGAGADYMVGFDKASNTAKGDMFYVDAIITTTLIANAGLMANLGDVVQGSVGVDTIRSSVGIDLQRQYSVTGGSSTLQFSGIEVVELMGTGAISARGNAGTSTTLIGNTGNNNLTGGTGNDVLDGGAGSASTAANVLVGGDGNDLYHIRYAGDKVTESNNLVASLSGAGATDSILTYGININLGGANHANVEYVKNVAANGTAGDKTISITGSNRAIGETLIAGDVGDTIDGKGRTVTGSTVVGGGDSIIGGTGNDYIYYYGSGDTVDGGGGNADTLFVKSSLVGNAPINVGGASDTKVTNFEAIQLESVAANVTAGTNIIVDTAFATNMTLTGNTANNIIQGGKGNDVIYGGGGADTINAGADNDFVEVGFYSSSTAGNASVVVNGGVDGTDTLSFGSGNDRIVFGSNVIGGSTIDVNGITHYNNATATTQTANISRLTATDFEFYTGGAGNDTLDARGYGKDAAGENIDSITRGLSISGGAGNDSIIGSNKGDYILLDGGNDTVNLGAGKDILALTDVTASTTVTVNGFNTHMDLVDNTLLSAGWSLLSRVQTSATVATLIWTNGTQRITMVMNDVIESDVKFGPPEPPEPPEPPIADVTLQPNETFDASTIAPNLAWHITGLGNNTITGSDKNDTIIGGTAHDASTSVSSNVIGGGKGNDSITYNGITAGDSTTVNVNIDGNAGNDTISVGAISQGTTLSEANVTIHGGEGNDIITVGNIGAGALVLLNGDAGNDSLYFTGGAVEMTVGATGAATVNAMSGATLANGVKVDNVEYYEAQAGEYDLLAFTGTPAGNDNAVGAHVSLSSGGVASLLNDAGTFVLVAFEGFNAFVGSGYADKFDFGAYNVIGADTLHIDGGGGNDLISIGNVSAGAKVTLDGGDGSDTLVFAGTDSITLNVASTGVSLGGHSDVTIKDFEFYQAGASTADKLAFGNSMTVNATVDSVGFHNGNVLYSGFETITASSGNADTLGFGNAMTVNATADSAGFHNGSVTYKGFDEIVAGTGDADELTFANSIVATVSDAGVLNSGTTYYAGFETVTASVASLLTFDGTAAVTEEPTAPAAGVTVTIGDDGVVEYEGTSFVNFTSLTGSAYDDEFSIASGLTKSLNINGGEGNDAFTLGGVLGSGGALTLDGGAGGDDRLVFGDTVAVSFTNAGAINGNVTLSGVEQTSLTINGIEHYEGSANNDTFIIADGLTANLNISGSEGNDIITVGDIAVGASVTLNGGTGDDTLVFGGASSVGLSVAADGSVSLEGHSDVSIKDFEFYQANAADGDKLGFDNAMSLNATVDSLGFHNGSVTYRGFEEVAAGAGAGDKLGFASMAVNATVDSNGLINDGVLYKGFDEIAVGGASDKLTFGDATGVSVTINDSAVVTYNGATYAGFESLIGGAGNDTFAIASGFGVSLHLDGSGGNDTLVFGDSESITLNANATGVSLEGKANVTIEGFEYYNATGAGDKLTFGDAMSLNATVDSLGFHNGSVTYRGFEEVAAGAGNADELIFATSIAGTVSDTGVLNAGTTYYAGFETVTASVASLLTFGGTAAVTEEPTAPAAGVTVTIGDDGVVEYEGTSFVNFTSLTGSAYDDEFSIASGLTKSLNINGGEGNDAFTLGGVLGGGGALTLDGGAGTDTLYLHNTNQGQSFVFAGNSTATLSYYNASDTSQATTTLSNVSISGFEYYKGNDVANYFDASGYTHTSANGNLVLEGGAGHDMFHLGNVAGGAVTLMGGTGEDEFYIGNVTGMGKIHIDSGTGDNAKDKLTFNGTDKVHIVLNAEGNIGTSGAFMWDTVQSALRAVAITSTGLNSYSLAGIPATTLGVNTFDASAVTSVDSNNKIMTITGSAGADIIKTGNIAGGGFEVNGGAGDDCIFGGAGNDTIYIGSNDGIPGTAGNDTIKTGGGNDVIKLFASAAGSTITIADTFSTADRLDDSALLNDGWTRTNYIAINGNAERYGYRVAYFKPGQSSIILDFIVNVTPGFLSAYKQLDNFEPNYTHAGSTPIYIIGHSGANSITGGAGNDTIYSGGGSDTIYSGGGNDYITIDSIVHSDSVTIKLDTVLGNNTTQDTISIGHVSGGSLAIGEGYGSNTYYLESMSGGLVNLQGGHNQGIATINANDVFNIGNITGGNLIIDGNGGVDSLYFTGNALCLNLVHPHLGESIAPNITVTGQGGTGTLILDGIEYIEATAGNDSIDISQCSAGMSALILNGGAGNDTLIGRTGHRLIGGTGDDLLIFKDVIGGVNVDGGTASDTLRLDNTDNMCAILNAANFGTNFGNDTANIFTSLGYMSGISQTNIATSLVSATGIEAIQFGAGNDSISVSGVGSYYLDAGAGNDTITVASIGANTTVNINGGEGDDAFYLGNVSGTSSNVNISGGTGNDSLYFTGAVSMTVADTGATVNSINGVTLGTRVMATGVEYYYGGTGNDTFTIGAGATSLYITGGAGNDTLDASAAGAGLTLSGGLGNDVIYGSDKGDKILLDGGNDTITPGNGRDTLSMSTLAVGGSSTVKSFSVNDDRIDESALKAGWVRSITSDGNGATVTWTKDDDDDGVADENGDIISLYFDGVTGVDTTKINFGVMETIAVNGGSFDASTVNDNVPWLITGLGNNTITGSSRDDTIIGGAGDNSIDGGNGDDSIYVGDIANLAAVYIDGGDGNDSVQIGHVATNALVYVYGGDVYTDTGNADTLHLNSTVIGQGQQFMLIELGGGYVQYYDIDSPTDTNSGSFFIADFEYYKGNDQGNQFYAGEYTDKAITLEGGAGKDTLEVYRGQLIGGAGDDLLILRDVTSCMEATITGTVNDGNDQIKLFGVTASMSGSGLTALNDWSGLVFRKDTNGDVLMSFAGRSGATSDSNILTFSGVYGNDTLSFYSGQAEDSKLFDGDVGLDHLYGYVTTNFTDNEWHGVNFTGTGTYIANSIT